MSETEQEPGNSYVATAAAEKRLREVLGANDIARFLTDNQLDAVALALLDNAKIEYKPRLKAVLVTLPIPDTATRTKIAEPVTAEAALTEAVSRLDSESSTQPGPEHSDGYQLPYEAPAAGFRPFQPKPAPVDGYYVDQPVD